MPKAADRSLTNGLVIAALRGAWHNFSSIRLAEALMQGRSSDLRGEAVSTKGMVSV